MKNLIEEFKEYMSQIVSSKDEALKFYKRMEMIDSSGKLTDKYKH